jgi:hypothetical protein
MQCNDTCTGINRELNLCCQALRPLPTVFVPCGYYKALTVPIFRRYMRGVICHEVPELEWCLSPLGCPVEVKRGSLEHGICLAEEDAFAPLESAHAGLTAEHLFAIGQLLAFEQLILHSTAARHHVLQLYPYFKDAGAEKAQHIARVLVASRAAQEAIDDIR